MVSERKTQMRGPRSRSMTIAAAVAFLFVGPARGQTIVDLDFVASTAAHNYAVGAYRSIWEEYGPRIVAALEARTCLRFPEPNVAAIIADGTSHSGGPEHPMQLRASYADDVKRATLVHELGHRHLWQLAERLDDVDGHRTLYLVLDRVWADVWGEPFAADRIRGESDWRSEYDYAAAWHWARALEPEERTRLWNELLHRNGFAADCGSSTTRIE